MDSSLPLVAVVGRANVGKSTLVNRLSGSNDAIVEEHPGVTRDRRPARAEWRGQEFLLVDTGGWRRNGDSLESRVSAQSERAVEEASVVLVVVDATVGATDEDLATVRMVRGMTKRVLLVANKVDSEARESDIWTLLSLGIGDPVPVSAVHGRGTGDLLDLIVSCLPEAKPADADDEAPRMEAGVALAAVDGHGDGTSGAGTGTVPSVAIVGRPNVGKSTLFNRLVGDERSVVHDVAGTTRDSVDTVVSTPEGEVRFVDTAGMRRRARQADGTEYYSMIRALRSIDQADVALLVIDAAAGVTRQDQRLAERVDAAGSPVVIILNKWETIDSEARARMSRDVGDELHFLAYAPVLRTSAKTGLGAHRILPAISRAVDAYRSRVPTPALNSLIATAQAEHRSPHGRVLYATQGASNPPTFTLFASSTLPATYLRYLERRIREHFDLGPTPIKLRVRRR